MDIVDNFHFTSGHIYNQDRLCFLTEHDEGAAKGLPNCQVTVFAGGEWTQNTYRWAGIGVTTTDVPSRSLVAVGRNGEVVYASSAGFLDELVDDHGENPDERGPLRGIRTIDGIIYTVGMGRQVYRRPKPGTWVRWETGLPDVVPDDTIVGFNAIAGRSGHDLAVVGWAGEIWTNAGSGWVAENSPTNLALFDIIVATPSEYYACGQMGVIVKGRHGQWERVAFEGPELEFRSLAWFNGHLYLADGAALWILKDGTLKAVDFGQGSLVPCHCVHERDGMLLSVAGKEVFTTTDGTTWTSLT